MKKILVLCVVIISIAGISSLFSTSNDDAITGTEGLPGCKFVLCACCGDSGITFDIYNLNSVYQGSVTTGNGGCIEFPPGPNPIGTTFYVQPQGCDAYAKTYCTQTCCGKGIVPVDTFKVLCCPVK